MKTIKYNILLVLLLFLSFAAGAQDIYQVTANSLNVRQNPSTQSAIFDKVKKGDLVTVETIKDDWAFVYTQDGAAGWVSKKYIKFVKVGNSANQSDVVDLKNSEKAVVKTFMDKYLHPLGDFFSVSAVILSVLGWLLVGLDERARYNWLGVILFISATLCSALFFLSSPNMNLTGLLNYLFFGAGLCMILLGQLATFREMTARLFRSTNVDYFNLMYITFIALSVVGLVTAICMWFKSDFYIGLSIVCGVALIAVSAYIATDAFTFNRLSQTVPAGLFYLYGCLVLYFLISIAIVITIPLAILLSFGYAFGSGNGSMSDGSSSGGDSGSSRDDFSWTGYIPNFHKGPTGNVGWDDEGNTYSKGPNGEWHRD